MPDQLQLRGGTTSEHNSFTGALREVTVDTTKKTLVVHDGSQAGGTPLMKESGTVDPTTITIGTGGTQRLAISNTEVVFNDTGADVDFRVEGDTEPNLLFVDASTDRVSIGTSVPAADFHVALTGTSTAVGTNFITLRSSASGRDAGIQFSDSATSAYVGMLGGAIYFADSGSSEMARFDTSGRLLIGTTTEGTSNGDDLTIATSGHTGLTIRSGTSSQGNIFFSDGTSGTDEYKGYLQYEHTTNALLFGTDATERMRIDSSGNVGIGTTSPQNKFHQHESSSGSNYHQFTNSTTGSGLTDGAVVGLDGNETLLLWNQENLPIKLGTNDTERMRIDSSGNVGIGEASPANLFHVKVSDTGVSPHASAQIVSERAGTNYQQFLTTNTGTSGILFGDGDDADVAKIVYDHNIPAMEFVTETVERMRIDGSGRVMIGTTTEGEATADNLTIRDSGHCGITLRSGTSSVGTIFFSDGTSGGDEYIGSIQYDHSSNFLKWTTNGSERMRITSTGKVGIGCTPDVMLDIRADDPGIQLVDTSGTNTYGNMDFVGDSLIFTTRNGSSDGIIDFRRYDGTTIDNSMRIDTLGNLLVGKTSATSTNLGVEIRKTQLVIGKTASGTENGIYFTHGTSYVGGLNYTDSGTSIVNSSDERLKKNIKDADDAGNKIDAIKVRKFDWKKTGEHQEYGFVAQELEPVFAHAVHTGQDDFKTKTVDYPCFVPLLVKEIQSLRSRVAKLEAA